jgi:hypothetical protein
MSASCGAEIIILRVARARLEEAGYEGDVVWVVEDPQASWIGLSSFGANARA